MLYGTQISEQLKLRHLVLICSCKNSKATQKMSVQSRKFLSASSVDIIASLVRRGLVVGQMYEIIRYFLFFKHGSYSWSVDLF